MLLLHGYSQIASDHPIGVDEEDADGFSSMYPRPVSAPGSWGTPKILSENISCTMSRSPTSKMIPTPKAHRTSNRITASLSGPTIWIFLTRSLNVPR